MGGKGVVVAGGGVGAMVGVAGAGTVGISVAGTGVGMELEQAANMTVNSAEARIAVRRRLRSVGIRLTMLTSCLRKVIYRWMYPWARPIS